MRFFSLEWTEREADRDLSVPTREKTSTGNGRRRKTENRRTGYMKSDARLMNRFVTKERAQATTQMTSETWMVRLKRYHSGWEMAKYLEHKTHPLFTCFLQRTYKRCRLQTPYLSRATHTMKHTLVNRPNT